VNIDEAEIGRHDRLLMGGICAEVTIRYDDSFMFKGHRSDRVINVVCGERALNADRTAVAGKPH
jgi:hypothetical protein